MDSYVVRFTVKPYPDTQFMMTFADSYTAATKSVKAALTRQGINASIVGAYIDTSPTFETPPFETPTNDDEHMTSTAAS